MTDILCEVQMVNQLIDEQYLELTELINPIPVTKKKQKIIKGWSHIDSDF